MRIWFKSKLGSSFSKLKGGKVFIQNMVLRQKIVLSTQKKKEEEEEENSSTV